MTGTTVFDERLKLYFGASRGAYSVVTWTEAKDGQVTVSTDEKTIVVEHFGQAELLRYQGNDTVLALAGLDARREFRLFPTGQIVKPKVKYPKPGNSELRLYFNDDEFKVRENHYWGVFERGKDIWIFQSENNLLDRINSGAIAPQNRNEVLEEETDDYQFEVNGKEPSQSVTSSKSWNRDPKVAAAAIKKAGYKCELHPDLPSFISRSTGNPFVEAHHLIPMKVQSDFPQSLDIEDNICALSPFSHRKLHIAKFEDIVEDLRRLAKTRKALLEYANISEDELLGYYAV